MAASHRHTDSRVRAWQTFSQLLPAAGDYARCGSMHTPAPSRCVFHRTDGRRSGRIDQPTARVSDNLDISETSVFTMFLQPGGLCVDLPCLVVRGDSGIAGLAYGRRRAAGHGADAIVHVSPMAAHGACVWRESPLTVPASQRTHGSFQQSCRFSDR